MAPGHENLGMGHGPLVPGHENLGMGHGPLAPGHENLGMGHVQACNILIQSEPKMLILVQLFFSLVNKLQCTNYLILNEL